MSDFPVDTKRFLMENVDQLKRFRLAGSLVGAEPLNSSLERLTPFMFKYSYDSLVYFGEDVEKSIQRVAKYGYDAIELIGEPQTYNTKKINQLTADHGIKVSSICSIYTAQRDLASPEPTVRRAAADYVKSVADLAAAVSCPVMIIGPTAVCKLTPWKDPVEERKWAIEGMRAGAEYAQSVGVNLTIECWNRYETYMINRLEQGLEMLREVGMPNVGVMGDTFHMNIDEANIADAFRLVGKNLNHVHLADSNRAAPGTGHTDFVPILQALKEIEYQGYLSFELLPASADPFGTLAKGGGKEFFDEYTQQSIDYLKAIEKQIA
jgi:sugar phosphate isomerase/epimerase